MVRCLPSNRALRLGIATALALPMAPGMALAEAGLEEVIVTAQRREQSLQETPIFVTALQADALENRVIRNTEDLMGNIPGIGGFSAPGARSATSLNLRGVSASNGANLSADPAVALYFDGKTAIVYGKNINAYSQFDAPGTLDQLFGALRAGHGVALPGADFLLSRPYEVLVADVMEAKHIGRGVIDGVECEHLAFRNFDTDWQLWVDVGDKPIPRKLVITSKTVNGAPQYTFRDKGWVTGVEPAPGALFGAAAPVLFFSARRAIRPSMPPVPRSLANWLRKLSKRTSLNR